MLSLDMTVRIVRTPILEIFGSREFSLNYSHLFLMGALYFINYPGFLVVVFYAKI